MHLTQKSRYRDAETAMGQNQAVEHLNVKEIAFEKGAALCALVSLQALPQLPRIHKRPTTPPSTWSAKLWAAFQG
jgi:hypothetical protein